MNKTLLFLVVVWAFVLTHPADAFAGRTSAVASQATPSTATPTTKAPPSDVLTARQLAALIATAKTSPDHLKLQKHYLAVAARYDAQADEHLADAQAYRKNPTFLESKTPGGPGTAAHCERFADLDHQAAKEARELAALHGRMANEK